MLKVLKELITTLEINLTYKMIRRLLLNIIYTLDLIFLKNDRYILFSSQPDLDDNSFAFFKHIIECKKSTEKHKIIWLIDNIENKNIFKNKINNCINNLNAEIIIVSKNSLKGLYYYLKSKFVFFTHGIYLGVKIPRNHIVVNLWHGMPLKNIGYLDDKKVISNSILTISTSSLYQEIMSKSFGIPSEDVLVTGQPRCDMLFAKLDIRDIFNLGNDLDKIILWMPTYRFSMTGDKRLDGIFNNSLPVLSDKDLLILNNHLKIKKNYLIIKLHVMDMLNELEFIKYSNIKIIKSDEFINLNISVYELLANVDLLLTDFSSVYIDFLLTLKPVGFLFDDIESYVSTRGFVFENYKEYMPAVEINNLNSLLAFLDEVFVNDIFEEKRLKLQDLLHEKKKNFSLNLFNELNERFSFLR